MFIFGEARVGYVWIFPKADHLSVGIATLHTKFLLVPQFALERLVELANGVTLPVLTGFSQPFLEVIFRPEEIITASGTAAKG